VSKVQVEEGGAGPDSLLRKDGEEELMFERLKDAINAALDAATGPPDARERMARMREAVIEARAAVEGMRQGVAKSERQLATERQHLTDAERRGRMAAQIGDQETADVAEQFTAKHRQRVGVLENKLEAQRAELALAEREMDEMKSQLKKAADSSGVEPAWHEIESAGGVRPETDVKDELLRSQLDRAAKEAEAEARLDALKKKMGR